MVRATLDTHLRVRVDGLPQQALSQICAALSIENPERAVAIRELLWNAKMLPKTIDLYQIEGGELVLPRGFYGQFVQGMQAFGLEVAWTDLRRHYEFLPITGPNGALDSVKLRDYQKPAVQALVGYEQGRLKMPTGGGKTACALEALRRVDQPTLIIVDKAALAEQWIEQIKEKLGAEAGYVGENRTEVRLITVALRQALWARFEDLERPKWNLLDLVEGSFFDLWATLIIDEDHHSASASTLQDLIAMFPARYRWGLSATPARDPAWAAMASAILGPILHETSVEDAGDALVRPSVRVLESDFEFDYYPTQIVDEVDPQTGEPIISKQTGKPRKIRVQNNYSPMMAALCSDPARNLLIADEIVRQASAGHHVLVVSRRKALLKHIADLLTDHEFPVQSLLGGESGKRKAEVQSVIESVKTGTVLLSTVAEEGLDVPLLDVVVVAYPARNTETLKQIIGRVMRATPGKTSALIVDIRDPKVGLLRSQSRDRMYFYKSSGFEIEMISQNPPIVV